MQEVVEKIDHSQAQPNAEAMAEAITPVSPHEVLEHLVGDVRKKVREVFIQAAETEFRSFIGADPYERTSERKDQRNGDRPRDLVTEVGTLVDLPIPRAREGSFMPSFLGRWQRTQKKVVQLVAEMFLRGVSTRKIGKLSKAIWGKGFSPATVSVFNGQLKEEFLKWMNRPIESPIRYLYLDGIALKLRRNWISREMLLCAIGITAEGKKEFLGFILGGTESGASWEFLIRHLIQRGLEPGKLGLVVIDGSKGLTSALSQLLPEVRVQRCIVHKLWNIIGHTPWSLRGVVPAEARQIFYAPNEQEARTLFQAFKERWSKEAPKAVACIEGNINELLSFYKLPFRHWKLIRSTNVIERAFKEFRRRVKIMETFPTEESCQRIMFSLAKMLNETWMTKPISSF
ncbi:MAG: IS256 family transposase [Ignavibacteria bacterium]|nr:MAG: IS256 family transposase [Ignavibacteria bacterium]